MCRNICSQTSALRHWSSSGSALVRTISDSFEAVRLSIRKISFGAGGGGSSAAATSVHGSSVDVVDGGGASSEPKSPKHRLSMEDFQGLVGAEDSVPRPPPPPKPPSNEHV